MPYSSSNLACGMQVLNEGPQTWKVLLDYALCHLQPLGFVCECHALCPGLGLWDSLL